MTRLIEGHNVDGILKLENQIKLFEGTSFKPQLCFF